MRRYYYFISMYREYFIFAILIASSFALFPLNDNTQIKQLRTYSVGIVGIISEPFAFVTETVSLRAENKRLRRATIELADEVYQLREASLENIRLRRLLDFQARTSSRMLPARVVGRSMDPIRNTLTIDIGARHGVREQMPVIADAGLVGRVILTSENYSIVQILFNRDFRTSAKVERTRVDGIVQWDGSGGMLLGNVAKTLDVVEGDVVVTSEYSNVFPAGIHIGIVSQAVNIPGYLTKQIRIAPGVDFARLEEVFVLMYKADEEKIALENRLSQ